MTPITTIWDDLTDWLDCGFVGAFPTSEACITPEPVALHIAGQPVPFCAWETAQALQVWHAYQAGKADAATLTDPCLSRVLEGIGFLLGQALDLDYVPATHFGDWLSRAITGISGGHGNDAEVTWCEQVASRAVYGDPQYVARGYGGPDFWRRYPDGVRAVVAALREADAARR